jgi:glycerol-3-phosphate dehydrogenase
MPKRAAIIGDGAMGTLCSLLLSGNGWTCSLWSAFEEHVADMRRSGENKRFLPMPPRQPARRTWWSSRCPRGT